MSNISLENLSERERAAVNKILKELSNQGSSLRLNSLLYADYKEIPVDIITFIENDNYLGYAWKDKEGQSKLYPY